MSFWRDGPALIRHLCQMAIGIVSATLAVTAVYYALLGDVVKATDLSIANQASIGVVKEEVGKALTGVKTDVRELDKKVQSIDKGQAVMQEQLNSEQRNNAQFQMRTDTALHRILEKLDSIEKLKVPTR